MRPTFYGLAISVSGLQMAQKQMDVTGHNIANEETLGYTRQRIVQQARGPSSIMTRLRDPEVGKVGTGVGTLSLDQIRDEFLDRRIRSHNSDNAYWGERAQGLSEIEGILRGEVGESNTSLTRLMGNFFDAVNSAGVDKESSNQALRNNLYMAAGNLTQAITITANKLQELQYEHDMVIADAKGGLVKRTNEILDTMQDYNRQIYRFEASSNEKALDLRDQRNLLIDELSTLVDIDYKEDLEGKMHLSIAGVKVVNHVDIVHLKVEKTATNKLNGKTNDLHEISFENGCMFYPKSGRIRSELDMRDGVQVADPTVKNVMGIPQIADELNTFIRTLAQEFNKVHDLGYTNTTPSIQPGASGFSFFEIPASGLYKDLNIFNFRLDAKIDPDKGGSVDNIALSLDEVLDPLEKANNTNALKLLDVLKMDLPGVGPMHQYINQFLNNIGSETKISGDRSKEYGQIAYELQLMFASTSGVDKDEEFVNIIRFNHAYTAASRNITTIDEQLDTLINRMGRVGL